MSDNIPFDIQCEIIEKVHDVKSLVRFRAVSKPWKSFIDSSEFIAGYGARDTQQHRLLLRYKKRNPIYPDEVIKYISFVDDVFFPHQQEDFSTNVPLLVKKLCNSIVTGSSCGLCCFHGYNYSSGKDMVVIWNPSLRKSVGIVVPYVLTSTYNKRTHFGFGVCPSTYDPTILGISKCYKHMKTSSVSSGEKWTWEITWEVGVFTLSSKTWKIMSSSNAPRKSIILESTTHVAIDRFIYWVACDEIGCNDDLPHYKSLILSFDLISQEFKEVQLPDSFESLFVQNYSISKLRESLVVSTYIDGVYEIWIMVEEAGAGVMTPFTKLFTINTPSVQKLLGFRKSDEPIMETRQCNGFFSTVEVYEPCLGCTNGLGIIGECGSYIICPYTESLLLIDHADGCIISNDC